MDEKALIDISYGLFVISSFSGEKFNGQISNTVIQVTAVPPRLVIAIHKDNLTHEYISESKVFSVSILDESTPMDHIRLFGFNSGRDINKFKNVHYRQGKTGCPIVLDHSTSILECKVISQLDAGSHTVFAAELVDAEVIQPGKPMTYAYYHEIKKGRSPKNAPTFKLYESDQPPCQPVMDSELPKYKCEVCGFIYDPDCGLPEQNIEAGIDFNDLPHDWTCPVCGAAKNQFTLIT